METVYTIDELKELLTPVFVKYGLVRVSVFGSYARGTAVSGSDINLLILIDDKFDLEDYINFKNEVTKTVDKDIDILEYRSINKKLEADILKEASMLYEKR
jgi:hypothetical protein